MSRFRRTFPAYGVLPRSLAMKHLPWTGVIALFALACSGGEGTEGSNPGGVLEEPGVEGHVASASQAIVNGTTSYLGSQNNQAACNLTRPILLREPDGPGPFPVFLYTGGAGEPHTSAAST